MAGLLLTVVAAAVACTEETRDRQPDGTGGSGAATTGLGGNAASGPYQLCVDTINQYRASVGVAPLQRWTDAESCVDGQAQTDSQHPDTPHYAFGQCGESAQDECPGWPGPPEQLIVDCLAMMWAEGPGGGHYENMRGGYSQVACGYYQTPNGEWWATQSFR